MYRRCGQPVAQTLQKERESTLSRSVEIVALAAAVPGYRGYPDYSSIFISIFEVIGQMGEGNGRARKVDVDCLCHCLGVVPP